MSSNKANRVAKAVTPAHKSYSNNASPVVQLSLSPRPVSPLLMEEKEQSSPSIKPTAGNKGTGPTSTATSNSKHSHHLSFSSSTASLSSYAVMSSSTRTNHVTQSTPSSSSSSTSSTRSSANKSSISSGSTSNSVASNETTVYAHSFAANRMRRAQSIDASSAQLRMTIDTTEQPISPPPQELPRPRSGSGERENRGVTNSRSSVISTSANSSLSATVGAGSVALRRRGHSLSVSLSATSPIPSPLAAAPQTARNNLVSPAPIHPEPHSAPLRHRRSSTVHIGAQLTSGHHSTSSSSSQTPNKRQKKPKAGPILNAPSSRLFLEVNDTPGVGAYRSYSQFSANGKKGVKMHERIQQKDPKAYLPAPGSYDGAHTSSIGQSLGAAVSMDGQSARRDVFTATGTPLGPGEYDTTSLVGIGKDGPAMAMHARVPDPLELTSSKHSTPGPASYDVKEEEGQGVSMKGSRGSVFTRVGEGADVVYELESSMGKGRSARLIGKAEVKEAETPGVGDYDGAYKSTLGASSSMVGMGGQSGRSELFVSDSVAPAPGSYELQSSIGQGPAASLRSRLEQRDVHAGGAAPGDYDAAHASTLQVTGGVSMSGQSSRSELFAVDSSAPSPGSYDVKSTIGQGPAAAVRSRIEHKDEKAALPAPGQYEGAYQSTLSLHGGVGMDGQQGRAELFAADELSPAPGQYDIQSSMGQAPAASIRSRIEQKDGKADLPAPGQYSGVYTSTLGQTAAGVSMDGTMARSELFASANHTPAVGSYDVKSTLGSGPAAAIRSRIEQKDVHAGGAGVGSYDGAYASTIGSTSSAVSMDGQAGRRALFEADAAAPAPGQYDLASTIGTGRAASIRSRIEQKDAHADGPAPGSYDGAHQSTLGQSASGTMSQTSRGELFVVQSDAPDVGSYDIQSSMGQGPAATIRSRIEQKDAHAGGAAPGQYDAVNQSTLLQSTGHVSMAGQSSRAELFEASSTPAPGSYEIKSRIGEGRVATIRSRIEEKIAQAANPAPGAYDGAYKSTLGASSSMVGMGGQSGRSELFVSDSVAPAPGSYELQSSIGQGPAASLRSRLEQRDVHAGGAAPGDYDAAHASTLQVTGGVSMSGQSSRSELFAVDSSAPSPGSYDVKSTIGQGPAAAIRSRIEHKDEKAALPAPGQYEGAYQSTLSLHGGVGMDGQQGRAELFAADELSPAPGQYDIQSSMGQAPAASIRSRIEQKDGKADLPAPGQYSGVYTSTLGQTAAGVSMDGTMARSELFASANHTPAVGSYDVKSTLGSGPAAAIRSRIEQKDVHAGGAGVGSYDGAYASTIGSTSSAVSMDGQAGRRALFEADAAAPAPGQYDLASTIGTGRAASIRSRIEQKDAHADGPAPGSYDGAHQSTLGQSASGTMSQTSRGELFVVQSDAPDVGSYDIQSSMGQGPAATIRSRIEQKDAHAGGAAPGQYDAVNQSTLLQSTGHVSMAGQSSRAELFEASSTPAPGSYEIKSRIGEGRVATIRSRIEEKIAQAANPAPGAYDGAYKSTLGASSSMVGMGGQSGRSELFVSDSVAPAPGSYELQSSIGQGPAASLRSRLEQRDVHAGGAAPGDYDAAHASTLQVTGGVSMSGQSSRSELFAVDSSAPSPGSYDVKSTIGQGPAAAIRSRIEHKDEKAALPAPGQYDGAYHTTLRTDSGAVSMAGSAARSELFASSSDAPAVGSYDIKSSIGQGPAASIRSKIEVKDEKAQLPAPGQYSIESTLGSSAAASNWKSYSSRSEQLFDHTETASAGPAAYNIQSTIGQGPAASIRSKIEVKDSRAANPAPGVYSGVYESTLQSGTAAASMALSSGRKAELFDTGDASVPAPGSYNLPSSIGQGPSASIRSRIEQADPTAANPGVGAYEVVSDMGSDAPAVRMRGYSERKEELFDHTYTASQGPAAYDVQSTLGKDGPAHSMAVKRELKDERALLPGVGQYDGAYSAQTIATQSASSAVSMSGQSARGELFSDSSDAPAPGSYSIPSSIGQGPATAVRSRIEQRDVHAGGAAPGDYDAAHASTLTTSAGVSMSTQSARAELFVPASAAPAPGSYDIRSTIGQGPAATVRGKVEVKDERINYPGVGEYNTAVTSLSSASAVSMAGTSSRAVDLFTINRDSAPVGSYDIKSSIGQGPAAAIRSKIEAKDPKAALPSPGQYDGAYEPILGRNAAGSVSMQKASGRSELYETDENAPAPGQYQIPSTIGQGPAASIRSVVVMKDSRADNPAPGEYDGAYNSTLGVTKGSAAGTMALASARGKELFDTGDASVPAPGSYNLPSSIGQGPSASIRSRIEQADPTAANPGVGAYEVVSDMGSDAPAVRMRGYSERKEELFDHTYTASQGPAAYDVQSTLGKDGPAHSMAVKRELRDDRESFPGVGEYDGVYTVGRLGNNASGAVSLDGQSARSELFHLNTDTADAGSYDIKSSIGQGPAASIRSRIEQKDVHAGGVAPGDYAGAYQSSLSQTGAASMVGTARSELFQVNTDTADVGAYDIRSTIGQGPAASIRARIEQKDVHAGGAAPGSYSVYGSTLQQAGGHVSMAGQAGRQELFDVDASAPAPGAYSLQSTIGQGPAASIRSRLEAKDVHAGGAAPGDYSGAYQSSLSTTGAASMAGTARSELFHLNTDTADAGSYDIKSSIGQGPAASIRSRIEQKDVHAGGVAPGDYAGAYQSSLSQTGAASMVGTARSELFQVNTDTADVGAYDIRSTIGQGPAASIRARIEQKDVHAGGAAPGSYSVYGSTLQQAGGHVSMAGQAGRQELFDVDASAPAPGAYSLQSTIGQGPAASIRSRLEAKDVHAGGAAPGDYSGAYQSSLSTTGAASMAGTARSELFHLNTDTADAGSYDIKSSIGQGPAASIRSRIEQKDVHAGGVAPGDYAGAYQSSLSQTGAASMVGTARSELFQVNTDTADVGAYDIRSTIGQGPAASIRARIEQKDVHAGGAAPGSYSVYGSTLQQAGGHVSMAGQAGRQELFDVDASAPAPGAYSLQSTIGQGPAASIRSRLEAKDVHAGGAAPGDYSGAYQSSLSTTGAASMAGTARSELFHLNTDTADAGSYDIKSSIGQGPAASIRSRIEQKDVHAGGVAPGDYAGAYQSSLSQTGAASMVGTARSELFQVNTDTADVGAYDIRSTIGQGPAASIRARIEQKDVHAGGAAPGSYSVYGSTLQQAGGHVSMAGQAGRQELFDVDASAPAPGAYSLQSTIGQGPAASIRSRLEAKDVHAGGAAPGDYSGAYQSSLSTTGAASMAGTARSELFHLNTDTADAGSYDIKSSIGQGPAASIRSRIEQKDVHAGGVAPGDYAGAYQSSLSQTGAASMVGTARSELFQVNTDTADVGAYDIRSTIGQGPAASIRARIEQKDVHAGGAAPGSYSVYGSTLQQAGGHVSMAGQAGRQELFDVDASAPAPGAYSLQSTIGQGPAASIRSRLEAKDVHAGGAAPGDYSGAYQSSLSTTGAASMAGTARSELFHLNTDTADAGSYDIKSSIGQGPAASIRSRIEQKDVHAGGVAPGDYAGAYQSSLSQTGAASMVGTARSELFQVNTDTADVGAYDIRSTIGQGPAASIRARIEQKDVHAGGAAPGSYSVYGSTLQQAGGHVSMAGQAGRQELFDVDASAPAPGAYSLQSTIGQGPAASIRSRLEAKDVHAGGAAPGDYSGAYQSSLSTTGAASMAGTARSELFHLNTDTADAGSYDIKSSIGQGPAASIRSRIEQKDVHAGGVAPGDYAGAYQSSLTSSGYTIHSSSQASHNSFHVTSTTPSPGAYTLPSTIGQGPAMAMHGRHVDPLSVGATRHLTPAPGAYDIHYANPVLERDFTFGAITRPSANLREFMDMGGAGRAVHQQAWDGEEGRGGQEGAAAGGVRGEVSGVKGGGGGWGRAVGGVARVREQTQADIESSYASGPGLLDD